MAATRFPLLTRIARHPWLLVVDRARTAARWSSLPWTAMAEMSAITLWAVWVGRAYLNMSPRILPPGSELGMSIHPHYIWTLLWECGACVLWNGFVNGGSPAFAELHAAVLHPIVIFTTLIWGGLNGAKVMIIASLAMAGIGQWWLARVMNLGWVARLWSAAMVVAGGHLAGRMQLGIVGLLLSTAACSLVLAPGLKLALSGKRRDTIWLGIALALAVVSGQGYMQLGLITAILPAFVVFFVNEQLQLRPIWREFALAGVLALLLAGIFLVPLAHFWPNFAKDINESFSFFQPIQNIPLNYVISDPDYYYSEVMGKLPYPWLYVQYIGWIPVLLALLPLRLARHAEQRVMLFFLVAMGLILWASSGAPVQLLQTVAPAFAASIRFPNFIAGFGVPIILTLAAWGVDRLLKINRPVLLFVASSETNTQPQITVKLSWLFTLVVLILALRSAYRFSQQWLITAVQYEGIHLVLNEIKTADTQWVTLPLGEHFWVPDAMAANLKLTSQARPARWQNRVYPPPFFDVTRAPPGEDNPTAVTQVANAYIAHYPDNAYAYVVAGIERIPCQAKARGGNIDVVCQYDQPGTLFVTENLWSGWTVKRDGRWAVMGIGPWLNTAAPAGTHYYTFRYRPWDIVVGFSLTLTGIFLAVWIWIRTSDGYVVEREITVQEEA